MTESSPESRSRLFARVYSAAQAEVRALLQPLMATLDGLGCGTNADFSKFEVAVRQILARFAHAPANSPEFVHLRVQVTPDARKTLLQDFLFSLGMDRDRAVDAAQRIAAMPADAIQQAGPANTGFVPATSAVGQRQMLFMDMRRLFFGATRLVRRLREIQQTVGEPYRGSAANYDGWRITRPSASGFADRGVEQTVELLQMFPELAPRVYQRSGLTGLEGFPPRSTGAPLRGDQAEFVNQVTEHLDDEATWSIISAVALVAGGIVLTVVTAGMAGPLVGMAVGGGLGLAMGGANVYSAQNSLTLARDSSRFGAGGEQRIAFLEGELQGAWGMLLADVVTGGILGRMGGAGNVGRLLQTVRTTAVSGAGAGLGTAANPNVWDAPDTAGILLKATVIGMAAGTAGDLAGSALTRVGQRVMVGITRSNGHVRVGATVEIGARGGQQTMQGQVTRIEGSQLTVVTPAGEVRLNVRDTAIVTTGDGSPAVGTPDIHGPRPANTSTQDRVSPRAPRVHNEADQPFARIRDLESPMLGDSARLQAMSDEALLAMSSDLMPRVSRELEALGYRTSMVRVPNEGGGEHMALQLTSSPGRLGTLMRRAGPAIESDVAYIYDPIGLARDGGSGLFDRDLNAVRFGHGMLSNAHSGAVGPFFHELRHGRTAVAIGNGDYPYHGTFYFDRNVEPGFVSRDYRDQFQVDEMYAYQRQSAGSLNEARRARAVVERDGLGALSDRRTQTFFNQGGRIAQNESITARGFARAVRTHASDMLQNLRTHASRVEAEKLDSGSFPSTQYRFKSPEDRVELVVEYWTDETGMRNAMVVRNTFDGTGAPADEGQIALHFMLGDAPPGYTGDFAHSLVVRRLEAMLAASDDMIQRAMKTEARAEDALEASRSLHQQLSEQ